MSNKRPGMFVPALVGGALAGILSGLPFLNCLCCLWIIGGAMLASYLLSKNSPVALSAGDGVIVGILTGIVAALVDAFLSLPFHAINSEIVRRIMEQVGQYAEEMPSGWETWLERGSVGASFPLFLVGLVISAFVFSALGILGGIIGISLFGRKITPPPQGVKDEISKDTSNRQP